MSRNANDVLQVADGSRQAIDARHDEHVALADEIKKDAKLGAALARRSRHLLGADDVTAGRVEGLLLNREILIDRADARVSVCLLGQIVSLGSKPSLHDVFYHQSKP
jgi:hypothetical protein